MLLDEESGAALTENIIDALLVLHPSLARLDDTAYAAGCRVIVRADSSEEVKNAGRVAVISGGGSGHEPAHAGFVGAGLLTAAVCGDLFASPSSKSVLAAIVAVSSPRAGCLLVVKNYTGDRLNFGIAAEAAWSRYGIPVETVYVADDVALNNADSARGLAGTLAVHKVAGALAQRGASLQEVRAGALAAASAVATMGVAYEICTLPGRPRAARLGEDQVELGMGIHGEPGRTKCAPMTASVAAATLLDAVIASLLPQGARGEEVALIVNDLGTTTPIELAVFAAASLEACAARGLIVRRSLVGALMTSLDMHGVSLTLVRLGALEGFLELLDAPCCSPAMRTGDWAQRSLRACALTIAPDCTVVSDALPPPLAGDLEDGARWRAALEAACAAVLRAEPTLTEMDEKVGDGDCGTTLSQAATAALALLHSGTPRGATQFLAALGNSFSNSMGGSSGALYSLGTLAAEKSIRHAVASRKGDPFDRISADAAWAAAFVAFACAISECGGAKLGSRTMCDATIPASDVLRAGGTLAQAAQAAREGSESTKRMVATKGRSAYVSTKAQDGVGDPGAHAIAEVFAAVANALP